MGWHASLTCPSLFPEVWSDSCPLSQWCYLIISSSAACFSFCLQLFPSIRVLFQWASQSTGASASASVLPVNSQGWFLLGLDSLIFLLSKGFSISGNKQGNNIQPWCTPFQVWTSPLFHVWFQLLLLVLHTGSQETGKVVCYSHLLKNFPQFVVIHTVKGFCVVNKAEVDVFLDLSCFLHGPTDVGNLIPLPFLNPAFTSGISWFTYCWSLTWRILSIALLACEMSTIVQ